LGALPIDFLKIMPEIANLNLAKLKRNGIRYIGAVFNTDPHTKPGKHWISMVIDL